MIPRLGGTLLAGCVAAAVARTVQELARRDRLPGGARRWERSNHRGHAVTLTEGVALVAATTTPLVLADPPVACAVLQAGVAGAVDDLGGRTDVKGLRGHLSALRRGEVTTGALKVLILAGAGLGSACWADRRDGRGLGPSTLAGAGLVAGSANLANLLDLRPGRALKVALAVALPLAPSSPAAAAVTGAGLTVLGDDLAGRSMLGDTGANALGAAVGAVAARRLSPGGRWVAFAGVAALTLLSERVSFTGVIEATPVLRELDRWGRR